MKTTTREMIRLAIEDDDTIPEKTIQAVWDAIDGRSPVEKPRQVKIVSRDLTAPVLAQF